MHINFKYFIVSIGSIFLALGIGILIGSNMGTNETIQKQNASIVSDIDKQFKELKEKDDNLVAQNKALNESIGNVKSYFDTKKTNLLNSALSNKNVGIISFNEKESTDKVETILSETGAKLSFNIVINGSSLSDENMKKINDTLKIKLQKKEELLDFIVKSIKNSDSNLSTLQDFGIINKISYNGDYNSTDSIVFYTGDEINKKEELDSTVKPLIVKLRESKSIVAVKLTSADTKYFASLAKSKVPTVNNIDETVGEIALVEILKTKGTEGNYGIVDTNTLLIPNVK